MTTIHHPQYIEFITRLRNARRARRVTQEQLAAQLLKPQSYVSKVETCERRLDLIEAAEWCLALGVRLEQMLPNELRVGTSSSRVAPDEEPATPAKED